MCPFIDWPQCNECSHVRANVSTILSEASEASLSSLGFGLPPSVPSWGGMLSREGRQFMELPHGWLCGLVSL